MNPTGRNIASSPNWKGRRSPWIGTKNIWKLFYRIGLLDEEIYENIMAKKPKKWDEKFADLVYENISVSQCRKQNFLKIIAGKEYKVYPVYYPIGNGIMNIEKVIEDMKFIVKQIEFI